MAKCVMRVTGEEAKAACGMEHLAEGVEAVINRGSMICTSYGHITNRWSTGGSSSLMRGAPSMRTTGRK